MIILAMKFYMFRETMNISADLRSAGPNRSTGATCEGCSASPSGAEGGPLRAQRPPESVRMRRFIESQN